MSKGFDLATPIPLDSVQKPAVERWHSLQTVGGYPRRWSRSILAVSIPPTHIPGIMVGLHDLKIGGHMGVRKTLEKIRRRFYWPGQKSDVVKWCSNCIACNSRKSPPRNKAPLEVSHTSRPLERI